MPSWDELVRDHGDRVYRLAYRLSGNSHDAEDITQETFIRVFRSLTPTSPARSRAGCTASPPTCSWTWSGAAAGSGWRRCRRRPTGSPAAGRPRSRPITTPNLDPDLQAALDDLLPEFRAAVVLCDVEGLSYEEIGATLGVKLGTVRSRIHRGTAGAARTSGCEADRLTPIRSASGVTRRDRMTQGRVPRQFGSTEHLASEAIVAYVDGELPYDRLSARRRSTCDLPGVRRRGGRPATGRACSVRPRRRRRHAVRPPRHLLSQIPGCNQVAIPPHTKRRGRRLADDPGFGVRFTQRRDSIDEPASGPGVGAVERIRTDDGGVRARERR